MYRGKSVGVELEALLISRQLNREELFNQIEG
jgi:hypothetical protein